MTTGLRLEDLLRDYQNHKAELDLQGVYFMGTITDEEADRFSRTILLMSIARQYSSQPITIYLNSVGGAVGAGFAIIEMMDKMRRDYRIKINAVVTGYAYSMGAIILQAADHRSMGRFSTLMLHGASWILTGDEDKIFKDYQKLAKYYRAAVGDLFARRTGQHDSGWWQRFIYSGRDKFLTAQECLKLGLVDEVCAFGSCLGQIQAEQAPAPSGAPSA